METVIVPFTIDKYDDVLELWEKCDGVGLSDADSRENIEKFLQRNPGKSLVALKGDQLAGAVLAGHDGRRGYLHHLAVSPDWRGRGIGRSLVEACLRGLRKEGILKCHVFLFDDNISGRRFWESVGWVCRKDIGVVSKVIVD